MSNALFLALGIAGAGMAAPPAASAQPATPLPVATPGDRMMDFKVNIGYLINDLPAGIAALNAGLADDGFVAQSRGTASPALVRAYFRELLPLTKTALAVAVYGVDRQSSTDVSRFAEATIRLQRARDAMQRSGKPDFSWVEKADRSVRYPEPGIADRVEAILEIIRLQSKPFLPSGHSLLDFTDKRTSPKVLDQLYFDEQYRFLRQAGLASGHHLTAKMKADPVLDGDFTKHFDAMHGLSNLATYGLARGAINSPHLVPRSEAYYASVRSAMNDARVHVRERYPDRVLPDPTGELRGVLPADKVRSHAPMATNK